ncbi:unknown [Haloarcula marismortui ATCC 43049]|nr:unknown [Haloarcula marismortui ATCC 43049]
MNTVYERVIERAVKSVAESHDRWEATGQAHTTNLISGTPTVNMYPDFAVSNVETETDDGDETVVVGDAKWKTGSVSNDDIYQLTSYVLARKAPGIVFYPAQDGAAEREYQIKNEWELKIVELPTEDYSASFESFVDTIETAVEDAIIETIDSRDAHD